MNSFCYGFITGIGFIFFLDLYGELLKYLEPYLKKKKKAKLSETKK